MLKYPDPQPPKTRAAAQHRARGPPADRSRIDTLTDIDVGDIDHADPENQVPTGSVGVLPTAAGNQKWD